MKTSAETHAEQRALAKERKMNKPNADSIQRSKKIWERLRRKSHVPKEERKELVTELFDIISGNIRDFIFKHDSVRVIQCALKYSTMEQRKQIATELKQDIRPLTESKYGKFLIAKMVVEGNQEIRDMIVPEFYGHVRRLINHPEGAWIMDDIYRQVATSSQKALLLREWYGAEYALFHKAGSAAAQSFFADGKDVTADLKTILEANPEKRKPAMSYLSQLINQLVQKKLTGFTMLHDAMLQYYLNLPAGGEEHTEFLELLKSDLDDESSTGGGDLLKNLAFTKNGSRVVCLALTYGTAKDRKIILRVYKDTVEMMALDPYAHHVLLTALEVTDDTKMSSNAIFKELLGETSKPTTESDDRLLGILTHLTARIPLLFPLTGPAKFLLQDTTQTLLSEVHAIRATVGTSKKNTTTRREELATYLSPAFLGLISRQASTMVTNTFGCQFVTEALLAGTGDKTDAMEAVAQAAAGDPSEETHIAQSTAAGKMLRSMVAGGKYDVDAKKIVPVEPALGFANVLYKVIKKEIVSWATGPSSFVVVALSESKDLGEKERKEMLAALKKDRKTLEKAAKGEEAKKVEGDKKKTATRGNAGAKILLEKL